MAKCTITFESASALSEGPAQFSFEVDEIYAPDFVASVAAHPKHGQVAETIMADTGQRDENDEPILGPATQMRAATFREGLKSWTDDNLKDPILDAVNKFRVARAQDEALANVNVVPIVVINEE